MTHRVLVIAPHPDDEIIGCAGTMARHIKAGDTVYVLVVTRGIPALFPDALIQQVRGEMQTAHQLLGVKETRVMDFPAPMLDVTPGYELANAISGVIREFAPDTVYIPHRGDIHADHGKVHLAALIAARPINGCSVRRVLSYETLSETDWAPPTGENAFIPTVFVDITEFLPLKLEAMKCFTSQLKAYPNTRSLESLAALARVRGGTISVGSAEAFMLIRHIETD